LSKLPASSIGSTTEAVVPAPAVDPVEVAPPPEERESGGRRLRRLARRLRPGPRTLVQSHHLHMSLAFLVPLMLLALHELLVRQRRSPWLVGTGLGLMARPAPDR
jgi:hypothetical protein